MAYIPTYLREKGGTTIVNPLKDYIRPFWLGTDTPVPGNRPTVTASSVGGPFVSTVTHEGHFEGTKLMVDSTSPNFTVVINYPAKRMNLMNREIHAATIFGDGEQPFILPETFWIPAIRSINYTLRDLSGSNNTIELRIGGKRWYHYQAPTDLAKQIQDYSARRERTSVYFLTTDQAVSLTANARTSFPATVTDDGDFEWYKTSFISTGSFRVIIRDSETQRQLMNGAVDSSMVAGTANFPFIMPEPYLVRRSTILDIEFEDTSGAPNTIWFTMSGRRVYYEGGYSGSYSGTY